MCQLSASEDPVKPGGLPVGIGGIASPECLETGEEQRGGRSNGGNRLGSVSQIASSARYRPPLRRQVRPVEFTLGDKELLA
jgi:hypothetical protein